MTILSKNNQSGRSMVEMLGVLAIIGVLSVGGISGYSKAMAKYKLTKAQDQITMLLMNIRTAYATSSNYSNLSDTNAGDYNIAPSDMIIKKADGTTEKLVNAFGGAAHVGACDNSSCGSSYGNTYFYIKISNLGEETCRSLASSDWGSDGLVGIGFGEGKTEGTGDDAVTTAPDLVTDLPISLGTASTNCKDGNKSITWVYY